MYFAASNTMMKIALISSVAIFWLYCAFSAADLARSNGGSYQLWQLIGLLTGPLGLVFAWLYFKVTGERHLRIRSGEDHQYDMPEIIRCPNCGQSVPSAYEICQFCKKPLHKRR
ncbi:MAG: hypothetical protein CVT63_01175 [Candidatus Anoxymicrobium japonicum]|uniref:Uncharacterized protein n=1 Tax=Candidatus Anoxymicrobium japonicum TaxID=2013648 RepID=A0A2N3G7R7_9ACTN|nr:MAG: hypothetical protein CVT63_01175 [Candidatus Anoxymicrobium japonicum]